MSILMATLIFCTSVIGDLFFSLFKRTYRIKDYARIIPGHGGLLDRLDSIFLNLPLLFYLYIKNLKNIAILGSTGSIGVNTLKIIKNNQGQFRVFALVSNKNYRLLFHQVVEFKPKFVYVHDLKALNKLKKLLDTVKQNTIFLSQNDDIDSIFIKKT